MDLRCPAELIRDTDGQKPTTLAPETDEAVRAVVRDEIKRELAQREQDAQGEQKEVTA